MKEKLPAILAALLILAALTFAFGAVIYTGHQQKQNDSVATQQAISTTTKISVSDMNLPDCKIGDVLCVDVDKIVVVNYHGLGRQCTWHEYNVAVGNTHAITDYSVVRVNGPSFPNWASLVIGAPNQEYYITNIPNFQVQIDQPDTCELQTVIGYSQQWGMLTPDELRALKILSGPTYNP